MPTSSDFNRLLDPNTRLGPANQIEIAAQAVAEGWYPTMAFDDRGRSLWSVPGRDGLVTLDEFRDLSRLCQAA